MGWKSSGVDRFDLRPPLQGQTRIAKLKSAYNSLIFVLEVWDGKPTYRKSWARNLLVWTDLTLDPYGVVRFGLGPLLQGQKRMAKLIRAYNSLIIGP